jgi:hypothetical protein
MLVFYSGNTELIFCRYSNAVSPVSWAQFFWILQFFVQYNSVSTPCSKGIWKKIFHISFTLLTLDVWHKCSPRRIFRVCIKFITVQGWIDESKHGTLEFTHFNSFYILYLAHRTALIGHTYSYFCHNPTNRSLVLIIIWFSQSGTFFCP